MENYRTHKEYVESVKSQKEAECVKHLMEVLKPVRVMNSESWVSTEFAQDWTMMRAILFLTIQSILLRAKIES